jgi:uncharacterized membrane-anchored protein YitT (DUF2179 family)
MQLEHVGINMRKLAKVLAKVELWIQIMIISLVAFVLISFVLSLFFKKQNTKAIQEVVEQQQELINTHTVLN